MICSSWFRSAVCTALCLAGIGDASAAPSLTMAHIYDGALDGYVFTWTTHSGGYYLFHANDDPNGSIINSAGGLINYELSAGDNRFFFFGDWDRGTPKTPPWGLVLGFNTPSSAFTIFSDHTGIAALTPEASSAYVSQAITEPWGNSTSFTVGIFNIVLSDFNISVQNSTGVDRVAPFNAAANGRDDAIGAFTLRVSDHSVTPIPLPSTYPLLLSGLGLLGFLTGRRKQQLPA